jgi:hypothetical protein
MVREGGDEISAWRGHTPDGGARPAAVGAWHTTKGLPKIATGRAFTPPAERPAAAGLGGTVEGFAGQVVAGRACTPGSVAPVGLDGVEEPAGRRPAYISPPHAPAAWLKDAAARMRGQERRMLLVAATPERYQAACRRHNRPTRTRHPPAPEPGALEHAPAARPRARSRSPEQPPSKPQKGSTQTSASAASVRLSDSDTPPSQQGAFKGGSVKRHQTKPASPESLPPNAGGSGHPLAGGRTAAGSSRDDAAKSDARVLSTGTLSEVTPVVTPFVNIQKLSGTIIVPPSLPETLYLDRYQPTKIQPSTKPIVRRGSSWLEAQQQAARAKLYLHGPFLEPHNVDAAAVLRMQAIENVPRSPPPSHRPLDAEAEDRAPRGWHPRDEQQNTPFLGVTSEQKKLRAAVDDNLNVNKPHMCGIEYMGEGQSWKLHPEHLEPSLADVARSMRRSLTGRWSVEPTAPSQPWKGVRKGRIFCNSIPNSDTPQRSRSSCAGPEDSENKSMDRSIQQENSSDYCLARKGPGAFHLVGASVPSLQRDGFRSQFGKKLDVMGRSSQDASVLTHGSYSEWREHPSKLVSVVRSGLWCCPTCRYGRARFCSPFVS